MLDRQDLDQIRGVFREEIRSEETLQTFRGVFREEIRSEETQATLRGVMREEIGNALEQVVLPRFAAMDDEITGMKGEISGMKHEISGMKATMVTKDYLDDKLADFKASLKNSAAWVGRQVNRLVVELHKGEVLTADQVIQIRAE